MVVRTVLIGAFHATLEHREVVFHGVGVQFGAGFVHVLTSAVVDGVVCGKVPADLTVDAGLIGHELRLAGQVGFDDGHYVLNGDVIHHNRAGLLGVAINQSQDFALFAGVRAFAVAFDFNHVGFVSFDNSATRAEGRESIIFHGFTDAVRHEPCSFQGNAQGAVQLVGADAFLAGS